MSHPFHFIAVSTMQSHTADTYMRWGTWTPRRRNFIVRTNLNFGILFGFPGVPYTIQVFYVTIVVGLCQIPIPEILSTLQDTEMR